MDIGMQSIDMIMELSDGEIQSVVGGNAWQDIKDFFSGLIDGISSEAGKRTDPKG